MVVVSAWHGIQREFMAGNIRLISRKALSDLVELDGLALDLKNAFQCCLFLWPNLTCTTCGKSADLGLRPYALLEEIQKAAVQAQAEGWRVAGFSQGVLTSTAYCPHCPSVKAL